MNRAILDIYACAEGDVLRATGRREDSGRPHSFRFFFWAFSFSRAGFKFVGLDMEGDGKALKQFY